MNHRLVSNRFWTALFILVFGFGGCTQQSSQPSTKASPEIGRYQLLQTHYTRMVQRKNGELGDVDEKTVMRIDTVTGKVERYSPSVLGDKDDKDMWLSVGN